MNFILLYNKNNLYRQLILFLSTLLFFEKNKSIIPFHKYLKSFYFISINFNNTYEIYVCYYIIIIYKHCYYVIYKVVICGHSKLFNILMFNIIIKLLSFNKLKSYINNFENKNFNIVTYLYMTKSFSQYKTFYLVNNKMKVNFKETIFIRKFKNKFRKQNVLTFELIPSIYLYEKNILYLRLIRFINNNIKLNSCKINIIYFVEIHNSYLLDNKRVDNKFETYVSTNSIFYTNALDFNSFNDLKLSYSEDETNSSSIIYIKSIKLNCFYFEKQNWKQNILKTFYSYIFNH